MSVSSYEDLLLEGANAKASGDIEAAVRIYRQCIAPRPLKTEPLARTARLGDTSDHFNEESVLRAQEQAVLRLGELFVETKRCDDLRNLLVEARPVFENLPKVRTAKIVRGLLDMAGGINDNGVLQAQLSEECIEWSLREKRTFLRHRVELRYAVLLHQQKQYVRCAEVVSRLLSEVKKLDDKLLLVEIHLAESRLYFSIKNMAKSKGALTSSRTNANGIHCPPLLQAEIDLQSGILHAEEADYPTAYSYFYEAFEAFSISQDPMATRALKYMLLAKILCDQPSEVASLAVCKNALGHSGREIDSLCAVAKSHKERSLKMFEETLETYANELKADSIIQRHIGRIHETLLEQNLLRILEPYSRVEIEHVAKLIEMPVERILSKLGEMILDKKIDGTLDQGVGTVMLFDKSVVSDMYTDLLGTFKNIVEIVGALQCKAQRAIQL